MSTRLPKVTVTALSVGGSQPLAQRVLVAVLSSASGRSRTAQCASDNRQEKRWAMLSVVAQSLASLQRPAQVIVVSNDRAALTDMRQAALDGLPDLQGSVPGDLHGARDVHRPVIGDALPLAAGDGVLATLDLGAVDGHALDQGGEIELRHVARGFHLVEHATGAVAVGEFLVRLEFGQAQGVPAAVRRELGLGQHDSYLD